MAPRLPAYGTLTRRTNDCCDKQFYNPICITHELRGPLGETLLNIKGKTLYAFVSE